MRRSLRYVLRLTMALAVALALQLAAGSRSDRATPYGSSLSSLGAGVAVAAPGCNSKFCAKEPGRKSPTCHQSPQPYNCSASGNVCTITAC